MKQTRTTLKELTAMYRAVLRHGILCNAIALGLIAAAPAMAEYTNVSLDELYPTGTADSSIKYTGNQNVTWLAENISVTEPGDGRAIEIGKNAAYSATEPTRLHLGGDNTNTININTGGDGILVRTKSVVDVHANDTISITSTVNDPSYDGGVGYGALWVQNSSDPGKTDTYATANLTANQINLTNLNASAIAALSEGRVNINGNATIKGKDAIYASGLSITNINAAGDKTVKMDGDIDFRQGPKTNAPVDATVNVTLNGAESYWTGNTVLSYEKKPSDDKLQINHGATIKMTDGATWTATEVAESAEAGVATNGRYYTALKNLNVNSGNVVVNRANGIQVENLAVGANGLNISNGKMDVSKSLTSGGQIHVNSGAELNVNATDSATFANSSSNDVGGAILNEGTLTLDDSTFTDNSATANGGAIWNAGELTINGGAFTNNLTTSSGKNGGAIFNSATGDIDIKNGTTFTGNSATNGGAIDNVNGKLGIDGAIFTGNVSSKYGGAVRIAAASDDIEISGSEFTGNYANESYGGAIYNNAATGKTLTLNNNTFSGNGKLVDDNGVTIKTTKGGALYNANAGTINIIGGSITKNAAKDGGGAIFLQKGELSINGTSITDNMSALQGGALSSTSVFNITNATIDGNVALNENAASYFIEGPNSQGNYYSVANGVETAGQGGAIYNNVSGKTSSVTGGSISHNIASEGGAIYNNAGTINIDGTTFDDNTAIKFAGAIRNNGTLNISDATFTNNVTSGDGGAIYNNASKTITIDGSNTFGGNKQAVEWDNSDNITAYVANDIYNNMGTINIISGAGETNTFAGGFDGVAGSKLNINGAGTTNIANALKKHTTTVNSGELHLTNADLTGSTIAVKSGATINTIDDDIKDMAEITLENGANFALDIDFANTKSDTYKINSGDSVNLTRVNLLSALSEVSDSVKLSVSDAGNIAIDSAVTDSVKAYTSAGAFSLVGNTADDGTIGLALTGGAGGLDTAVDLTDVNIDESIVYQVTTDETFGSAPDTTIARANFVIRGGNNVVTASGADSIKVASDSKVEINDLTLGAFNVAALENAGETTLNNVTLANTNAMAIKNDGFMKINHSNILADVLNRGTLISDPTTYSGVFTNDAGASASFDADTFTSTAVLANAGTVDLTNGVTFASGASITGAGVTNLVSGTTHFDNTTSTNTINLASGANFDGALVNNGVLNTQNGAIDTIDGSVSGGVLNIDARLGTTSGIDKFAAGNTGAIKTINILGTEYGTANSVSLEIGDATLDSNLQINGMNYYTKVAKDGTNLVFSDKLINESNLYNKLGSWTGGNYIKSNVDMANPADANHLTVGGALKALDTAIGDISGFGSQNYAKNTGSVAANITALDTQLKTVSTAGTIAAGQTGFVTGDAVNTALAGKQATITNTSTIIADGTGLKVADGSIGATQLAANSVSSANIIDGTITFADLNSNMVATSTSVNVASPSDEKLVTEKAVVAGITNLLADKQAWTDSTLGITSADADAVKNAYTGTNYLSAQTTLTDADKALDTAIKNNANAIAGITDGTTYTTAMENNVKGTINSAAGAGLTATSGVLSVNTATSVADGDTGYVTSDLLYDQGYQTASDVNTLIANAATGTGAIASAIDDKISAATTVGTGNKNFDDNVSAKDALVALDNAVGDMSGFNDTNNGNTYATDTTSVAANISALDTAAASNAQAIAENSQKIAGIENGTTVVAKAAADGSGNNIETTYAKQSSLSLLNGTVTDNANAIATLNGTGDGSVAKAAANAVEQANAYTDARLSALHDNSVEMANAYTDRRIEDLDKNLSAGVAGAVALSSVAVSGVERGEVSVGAGYGYFNGQSAAAFGATMGLSNRWSVNAGAGISNADVSFRAGTNYKFKLF